MDTVQARGKDRGRRLDVGVETAAADGTRAHGMVEAPGFARSGADPAAGRFLLFLSLFLVIASGEFTVDIGTGVIIHLPAIQHFIGVAGLLILFGLELADRVAMKRDLEIARDIQGLLLPASPPAVAGVDLAFATRPANTAGGDYYDAFPRTGTGGSGRLFLVVADVAGKGPAGVRMATFQASLRTLAESPDALHELAVKLNRYGWARSANGTALSRRFWRSTIRNHAAWIT